MGYLIREKLLNVPDVAESKLEWRDEVPKFIYMSKGLTGWDAKNGRILNGEMDCFGGHEVSIVTYDAATNTWTSSIKGCDGKGEEKSSTLVIKLKDKDSLEVQELNRKGGFAQGDSPKYIYKRVAK